MFPFGRNPYSPAYRSYDSYEEMLLQQELQRRRQAEEYHRRRQLEELNRRRAEQLEYARRQAEIQRRREAEARYLHQQELEARRRKFSEPSRARIPHVRVQDPSEQEGGRRQSMLGGGIQDLFDTFYGDHVQSNAPSPYSKRSKSSDPRARQQRVSPIWAPAEEASEPTESAVSDGEASDEEMPPPLSTTKPTDHDTSESVTDTKNDSSNSESDRSHSTISDILKSFSDLKTSFTFPSKLNFLNSPDDSDAVTPKLAYTPNNAPLHQYEHLLTGLLTKLDAVESYGQESIRKARKEAVRLIEQELEELDVKKLQTWRESSKGAALPTADVEAPSIAQDLGSEAQTKAEVDPASIPLPRDEDLGNHFSADTSSTASSDSVITPTVRCSALPSVSTEGEGGKAELSQVNPDPSAPVPNDLTAYPVERENAQEESKD